MRRDRERAIGAARAPVPPSTAGEPHRVTSNLEAATADLAQMAYRFGFKAPDEYALTHLAGLLLETFATGVVPATLEDSEAARKRERQEALRAGRKANPRTEERTVILYGDPPLPVYVLRLPAGTVWRDAMRAAGRLAKRLAKTPARKAAPRWNVDGAPDWETTTFPRFIFNLDTYEFEEV